MSEAQLPVGPNPTGTAQGSGAEIGSCDTRTRQRPIKKSISGNFRCLHKGLQNLAFGDSRQGGDDRIGGCHGRKCNGRGTKSMKIYAYLQSVIG